MPRPKLHVNHRVYSPHFQGSRTGSTETQQTQRTPSAARIHRASRGWQTLARGRSFAGVRCQCRDLTAVATVPPSRARKVKPWATTRARIISWERRVLPFLKHSRP